MKSKIALVVGIGIGYVLGTRAGRERFEQIRGKAEELWHSEDVQSAVGSAQEKVTAVAKEQGAKVAGVIKEQSVSALGRHKDEPDPKSADDFRI
ncbi:hypothetical protein [Cellulosimicrobium arenosum]|uniref:YtxH domain-containing protein n=1 Tax=Cellulosimicrobium arenosum TaxID=2708133 RepID=A0A927J109_9MICO|nr:hypothetical protein [Cellulosimicrobium arenosum]MBD8079897.1 hypothetical protein [Cellulosimicrobium arenosum]